MSTQGNTEIEDRYIDTIHAMVRARIDVEQLMPMGIELNDMIAEALDDFDGMLLAIQETQP